MGEDHTLSMRARRKVKAQLEKAERERFVAMFTHRMDLSRKGVEAFKKKDYKTALQYYHAYLNVLEQVKKVRPGDLSPKVFDPKKDGAELLMITGIYWDLAKIYDRINTKDTTRLRQYLDRFVIFSLGASYQKLSTEMMRKFLTNDHPRNRGIFKESFVKLGGGRCFVATAVEEYCEPATVPILKKFRDEVLAQSSFGRGFIRAYYWVSPTLAIRILRSSERYQLAIARGLNRIASVISSQFFPDGK